MVWPVTEGSSSEGTNSWLVMESIPREPDGLCINIKVSSKSLKVSHVDRIRIWSSRRS